MTRKSFLLGLFSVTLVVLCGFVSCSFDAEETKSNIEKVDNYDPDTDDEDKAYDSWRFNMSGIFTVSYTNTSSRKATYEHYWTDLVTVFGYASETGAKKAAEEEFKSGGSRLALIRVQTLSTYKSDAEVTNIKLTNFVMLNSLSAD